MEIHRFQELLVMVTSQGLSIRELARKSGVSASTISRIINGRSQPDIKTIKALLEPLGYKLEIKIVVKNNGA